MVCRYLLIALPEHTGFAMGTWLQERAKSQSQSRYLRGMMAVNASTTSPSKGIHIGTTKAPRAANRMLKPLRQQHPHGTDIDKIPGLYLPWASYVR